MAQNFKESLRKLGKTLKDLPQPTSTPVSAANAEEWNRPGGGYDQWKEKDPEREKDFPPGSPAIMLKRKASRGEKVFEEQ